MNGLKLYTVNAVSLAVLEMKIVAKDKQEAEEKMVKMVDELGGLQIKTYKYDISTTDPFDQIVVEDGFMRPHENDLRKWGYETSPKCEGKSDE